MLATLKSFQGPVFIQSFEQGNLQWLRAHTHWPLVQLVEAAGAPFDRPDVSSAQLMSESGLREVAQYAHAVGVHKGLIVPRSPDGRSAEPTQLIEHAHAAGLEGSLPGALLRRPRVRRGARHHETGAAPCVQR